MKEGNELHGVDQGLNIFNCIGYHWLDKHAMQALATTAAADSATFCRQCGGTTTQLGQNHNILLVWVRGCCISLSSQLILINSGAFQHMDRSHLGTHPYMQFMAKNRT